KQAPRAWYSEIDTYLTECGFHRSPSEATLCVRAKEGVGTLIVSIYIDDIDDIVYTGSSDEMMEEFKAEMMCKPDIMFSASLLARFMHSPSKKHYGAAKRVLRYIQGTIDYGIEYAVGKSALLIGYCDSDWSGSEEDMKSTSGYAFSFGSDVFSWASVKQHTTATTLFCDNTSAIAMSKNPVFHQRSKHIHRKFHFIRDAIQGGEIDLVYCKGEEQIADIFTKALSKDIFSYLRSLLGVKSVSNLEGSVEN
ncbi:unnamed protein product, partial [Prunus brigantina]